MRALGEDRPSRQCTRTQDTRRRELEVIRLELEVLALVEGNIEALRGVRMGWLELGRRVQA
jgi:hypothetical protein